MLNLFKSPLGLNELLAVKLRCHQTYDECVALRDAYNDTTHTNNTRTRIRHVRDLDDISWALALGIDEALDDGELIAANRRMASLPDVCAGSIPVWLAVGV